MIYPSSSSWGDGDWSSVVRPYRSPFEKFSRDVLLFSIPTAPSLSLLSSQIPIEAPYWKPVLGVSASPSVEGQTFPKFDNDGKRSGPTSFDGVLLRHVPVMRLSGLFKIAPATLSFKGNISESKSVLPRPSSCTRLRHRPRVLSRTGLHKG